MGDLKYNGTCFVDNYEYKYTSYQPANDLVRIYNSEGYVMYFSREENYYAYFCRDHLGSIREVWLAYGQGATIQRTQYYPSGLPWDEGTGGIEQPFRYNGKEWIEAHGLDEYDSEARWYYPAITRTTTMDPLCEKYYHISPYAWCGNNPVRYVDPDGMDWYWDMDLKLMQFNNELTRVNAAEILTKNQRYMFDYSENIYDLDNPKLKGRVDYRKDGSIFYQNETGAYKRMWNQANAKNVEVASVALMDGRTLVLPDYKNNNSSAFIDKYGYSLTKGKINEGSNNSYQITGFIHTHQDKFAGDPTPSTGRGEDIDVSRVMGGLPIITMGWDEKLHGIMWTGFNNRTGANIINTIDFKGTTNEQLTTGKTNISLNLFLRTLTK